MRSVPLAIGLFALVCSSPTAQGADVPLLPDPIMTPGAVDPSVTLSDICNGTTKARRGRSTGICRQVFAAYSVPPGDRALYECDHLTPVALGGLTVGTNLWPQPNADAALKDRLEVEMQRRACVAYRTLSPSEATEVLRQEQREISDDWVAAYDRYVLNRPTATAAPAGIAQRLRTIGARLRRWSSKVW